MGVCGGWSLEKHDCTGSKAITLWCRAWSCVDCAPHRVSQLKRLAADGLPTTFITLTVNPARGQSVEQRAAELSDAWRVIAKRIRRKFTKASLDYLAVFEETRKGEPHLHILARAPYVPQRWLSDQMRELIEAPIVDIRRVKSAYHAANYVAKYVGKGPKSFGSLKRYWCTPKYDLQAAPREPRGEHPTGGWQVVRASVWQIAEAWRLMGRIVNEDGPNSIFAPVGLHSYETGPPMSWRDVMVRWKK
jgi:hypothetical protein